MRNYKSKRIYLNTQKTKYCIVKLFGKKKDMQDYYFSFSPQDADHYLCQGVSIHYEKINAVNNKLSPETGMVLLHFGSCGAGIVTHELMHAVLYAYKHKKYKKQYPIVIKNMAEEERILRNHTFAVREFYKWYWKVEKYFELLPKKKK